MPRTRHGDHRLDDLLSDPIALLLMRRDGVEAATVRELIRSKARHLPATPERSGVRPARHSLAGEQRPAA